MQIEPLTGPALRTFAVSLAWELTDLEVAGRVHGAVDPDHVGCGDDGLAVLISPSDAPLSPRDESVEFTSDVAGWGQTVAFAATRRLPPLGSRPAMHDAGLASVIGRAIAVAPRDRPHATQLELLLADLELGDGGGVELPASPVDAANMLAGSALLAAIRREEQALRLPGLRGSAPRDLLGATSLGPVTRAFVTHLRFWALLACVSIVVGVGLAATGLRSSNPMIWAPGLTIALVGLVLTPWLLRSWGTVAVLYEGGFAVKKRTRQWTARWDELSGLRLDVRKKPGASYASVQIFGTLTSGGRFRVPRAVFGRETLVLASMLDRRTFPDRLSSARADLQRGERDFGPIKLTRAGVTYKRHTIPWAELSSVRRIPHNAFGATTTAISLVGRVATGGTETFTVPEYRLWDFRVLLAILDEPPPWQTE